VRFRLAGLALGSLFAAGCAGAPLARPATPLPPPRAASLEEVRNAYDGFCHRLATLDAKGDLDVRDLRTGKAQKLGVRVLARSGGQLYIKGSVAVVTALEVVSDGTRFWLQVPSKKTVWTGPALGAAESQREDAPYYALRPGDLAAALLPEPLEPAAGEALLLEGDRQTFSLTLAQIGPPGVVRRRVSLSRDSLQPRSSRRYGESGDLVSEVSFGDWQDGFPRHVTVVRPLEGYVAAFSLSSVRLNQTLPDRVFLPRTPDGYKVVEVS